MFSLIYIWRSNRLMIGSMFLKTDKLSTQLCDFLRDQLHGWGWALEPETRSSTSVCRITHRLREANVIGTKEAQGIISITFWIP